MVSTSGRSGPRATSSGRSEAGVSLVGTISVVVIIGAMALFAMRISPTVVPSGVAPANSARTGSLPNGLTSGSSLATVTACRSDYLILTDALTTYRSLFGATPPSGRAWATTGGTALLRAWPTMPAISFVWNGTLLMVVPATGVASRGSPGTRSPPTGCCAVVERSLDLVDVRAMKRTAANGRFYA